MKALTLWQPWATLIAIGAKRIETRHWFTRYRGPLAIHAAQRKPDQDTLDFIDATRPMDDALVSHGYRIPGRATGAFELPLGCVVAVCRLEDCLPTTLAVSRGLVSKEERAFGDFSPGRWAWVLRSVEPLPEPMPVRGAQGLWDWDETEVKRG